MTVDVPGCQPQHIPWLPASPGILADLAEFSGLGCPPCVAGDSTTPRQKRRAGKRRGARAELLREPGRDAPDRLKRCSSAPVRPLRVDAEPGDRIFGNCLEGWRAAALRTTKFGGFQLMAERPPRHRRSLPFISPDSPFIPSKTMEVGLHPLGKFPRPACPLNRMPLFRQAAPVAGLGWSAGTSIACSRRNGWIKFVPGALLDESPAAETPSTSEPYIWSNARGDEPPQQASSASTMSEERPVASRGSWTSPARYVQLSSDPHVAFLTGGWGLSADEARVPLPGPARQIGLRVPGLGLKVTREPKPSM